MGAFDPVPWEVREAALGPPAREIAEYVERMADDLRERDASPYRAVKAVHDALSEDLDGADRTVPGLGEVFVTAYLLEKKGVITPEAPDGGDDPDGQGEPGSEYPSLVERRPSRERLEELFWERERTLWWIGIVAGVHPSLVTYWLYEDDVPLMERNYTEESMEKIRARTDFDRDGDSDHGQNAR